MRTFLLASFALMLSMTAGCPGNDGNYANPSAFYGDLEGAYCDFMVRCGVLARAQRADCVASIDALRVGSQKVYSIDDAVSQGRVSFDGGLARSCLDALRTSACSAFEDALNCNDVFKGLLAPGAACKSDAECSNGYCSGSLQDGCAGTCVAFPATGAACASNGRCADTDYCDATRKCAARLAAGATCMSSAQCQQSLGCNGGQCAAIVGAPTAKAGEACFPGTADCVAGLYCDVATMPQPVCKALAAAGAPCTNPMGCQSGLTCIGLAFDGMMFKPGQCAPFLDAGQSCDPAGIWSGCPLAAPCDMMSKTCKAPKPVPGDICQRNDDCQVTGFGTLYCNSSNVCAKPAELNGACDPADPNACFDSHCDPTQKVCVLQCS